LTDPKNPELGVYVKEHVDAEVLSPESGQLAPVEKVPDETGLSERVTLPVGTTAVPGDLSFTLTTQLVGVFTVVPVGLHTTLVSVDLWTALMVVWPELPECLTSPG
jgi:hypothetical protein